MTQRIRLFELTMNAHEIEEAHELYGSMELVCKGDILEETAGYRPEKNLVALKVPLGDGKFDLMHFTYNDDWDVEENECAFHGYKDVIEPEVPAPQGTRVQKVRIFKLLEDPNGLETEDYGGCDKKWTSLDEGSIVAENLGGSYKKDSYIPIGWTDEEGAYQAGGMVLDADEDCNPGLELLGTVAIQVPVTGAAEAVSPSISPAVIHLAKSLAIAGEEIGRLSTYKELYHRALGEQDAAEQHNTILRDQLGQWQSGEASLRDRLAVSETELAKKRGDRAFMQFCLSAVVFTSGAAAFGFVAHKLITAVLL